MDKIEQIRAFCAAAELSNFRSAAIRLGMSPQGVTRAIKELEFAFGEALFHRNTRQVHITEFGQRFFERARDTLGQLDDLFLLRAQDEKAAISGSVHITAPGALGRRWMMRRLSKLSLAHPKLALELRLNEQLADVVAERVDVGVRIGHLNKPSFVARTVGRVSFFVVATPARMRKSRKPVSIADLPALPVTALINANTGRAWPWVFANNQQFQPAKPAFVTDDPESECEAVLGGLGYGQLPSYLALPFIRSGKLVPVLERYAPPPWDIHVFRPQRSPTPARVRLVFDALVDALSDEKAFPTR